MSQPSDLLKRFITATTQKKASEAVRLPGTQDEASKAAGHAISGLLEQMIGKGPRDAAKREKVAGFYYRPGEIVTALTGERKGDVGIIVSVKCEEEDDTTEEDGYAVRRQKETNKAVVEFSDKERRTYDSASDLREGDSGDIKEAAEKRAYIEHSGPYVDIGDRVKYRGRDGETGSGTVVRYNKKGTRNLSMATDGSVSETTTSNCRIGMRPDDDSEVIEDAATCFSRDFDCAPEVAKEGMDKEASETVVKSAAGQFVARILNGDPGALAAAKAFEDKQAEEDQAGDK